jgi:quinoprotein glucose dehydrogenase
MRSNYTLSVTLPAPFVRTVPMLLFAFVLAAGFAGGAEHKEKAWADYGGGPSNSHYLPTDQITKENVNQLQVAWTYPTRDTSSYYFNPVIANNVMYVLARNTSLVALDATTGKEIWVHENLFGIAPRGINYWESKDGKDRRLIFQMNNTLQEIDARTGRSIALNFGNDGFVDLRQGLRRDPNTIFRIQSSTPGKIFEDLIILGSATGEGYMSPPGDLRAFNVRTGKLVWQFRTIPHPGEFGYDTWPKDSWKYIGGTNSWGEITVDDKRGIAFFPTGSPTYDFYGGDRPGTNLFANCLLALDARTGKRLWHFQGVHHDLWDYDFTAAPQLLTVTHDGKKIDAVAQASKQGFLYVFDRVTGKPLWPIEERAVSTKTNVPGETPWPTQPFPTAPPPFARQKFTVKDLNPHFLTSEERIAWTKVIQNAHNGGLFAPPLDVGRPTMAMPGDRGGAIWGMTSSDPDKGLMYVASVDVPFMIKLEREIPQNFRTISIDAADRGANAGGPGRAVYSRNCQACHGANRAGAKGVPSLIGVVSRLTAAGVRSVVRNGVGKMPAFGTMSATDLDALIAYLAPSPGGYPRSAAAAPSSAASLGGPIVASGGAPAAIEFFKKLPSRPAEYGMSGGPAYPKDVQVPAERYYTGFDANREIISPPWSSLTAYDLNKGTIKWKIPLGEEPRAVAEGLRNTGIMQDQRSVLVTPTGLLFSSTSDGYIRALDANSGKVLWSAQLPAAAYGIPAMYEVNGRAYIVVSAAASRNGFGLPPSLKLIDGGSGQPRAYVAFALPAKP